MLIKLPNTPEIRNKNTGVGFSQKIYVFEHLLSSPYDQRSQIIKCNQGAHFVKLISFHFLF